MKKGFIILAMLSICAMGLIGCGVAETQTENESKQEETIVNPMTEETADTFSEKYGNSLHVPEGASDVQYFSYESDDLGEIKFTLDGLNYIARVKEIDTFTDISGLYYEWTVTDDRTINDNESMYYRYIGENSMVDLYAWYSSSAGKMYSLSVESSDLEGFDIEAIVHKSYSE